MEYDKILKNISDKIKKTTLAQRAAFILLAFFILAVVIYFINPVKKTREWRNSQRRSDIISIINAVYQFSVDNGGFLPEGITNEPKQICRTNVASCEGMIDLTKVSTEEKYQLSEVPVDPKEKNTNSSGYTISKLANGRIKVSAPMAENKAIITISK